MLSDKKFYKRKNILDANYQKHLNYFNILSISLITSLFTVFWAYFTQNVTFQSMIFSSTSIVVLFGTLLAVTYQKMANILKSIEKI